MRSHLVFFMLSFVAAPIHSNGESAAVIGRCAVWGHVITPARRMQDPTVIELIGVNSKSKQKSQVVNGNFDFDVVLPGWYQFRILDRFGREIHKRPFELKGNGDHVTIAVPEQRSVDSTGNVISFAELKHQISAKARREFDAAYKTLNNGELQTSSEHLVRALEIDPQYAAARTTLAAVYFEMGRLQEALPQAQKAFEINPTYPESGYDYAALLFFTKDYKTCETAVRSAIRNQYYTAQLQALLAVSLIGQGRNLAEAFSLLGKAATDYPQGRLLAAEALMETQQPGAAVNQLRTYLNSSANECERVEIETRIAELNQSELGKGERP